MRGFFLALVSGAALVAIAFADTPALSEDASASAPCTSASGASPDKLIESCTVIIDAAATSDADRVGALIARANAFDAKSQIGAAAIDRGMVDRGMVDRAMVDLERAIKLDANNALAFRRRGELLRHTGGDLNRAILDFNEAIRLDPNDAVAFDGRGNTFNNMRKFDRAIDDYNEAIRLDPKFAQAFSDRGAAYYFKGDYQKAIDNYDEAIRIDPTKSKAFTNRGAAYKKLGRPDHALLDESEAIRLDPTVPEYFDNRGLSYAANNDYAKAIADYTEAIRLRPKANFLTNRGDSYQFKGDFDHAMADYDLAIRLDAAFAQAYNNRAALWRKKGDRVHALADYDMALRVDPRMEAAIAGRKSLALEIERIGAQMSLQSAQRPGPSFNCLATRRAVEKTICADARLSRLDQEIADMYDRVIRSSASRDRRTEKKVRDQQREFLATRNSSFGKPDYDVGDAMTKRLEMLRAMASSAN